MSFLTESLRNLYGDYLPESFAENYLPEKKQTEEEFQEILFRNPRYIHNPLKSGASILEENCMAKMALVGGTSYAMGLALGAFIHMNHYEMNNYETGRGTRTQMRITMRDYFSKIHGTARSFVIFGCLFAAYECNLERQRGRSDTFNVAVCGGATMMTLAQDTGMRYKGLLATFIGGGLFSMVFESISEGLF